MENQTNSASASVSSPELLQISSAVAEKLADGQMQIVSRWKDSKDKTVSPANRVRAIVLPANIWSAELQCAVVNAPEKAEVNSLLRMFLLEEFEELAKKYLSAISEESNMQRTQVPASHFSVAHLLSWQSEMAAISGRLNGEEIKNWLSQSVTIAAVNSSHGEKIATALGEQFVKLASPNHGLTPEKASKLLSSLWKEEDANSTTGLRVQMRLTAISRKSEQTQNLLDSIL